MLSVPDHAIRVFISHRNELIQSGLMSALAREEMFSVHPCDGVSNLRRLLDYQAERNIVVVSDSQWAIELLDRKVPGSRRAETAVVVVGGDSEREVREALAYGARGYLTTDCSFDEVAEAVRDASLGKTHLCRRAGQRVAESLSSDALTPRENDVLLLAAKGMSNKGIARHLELSVGTVKCHMRGVMGKLQVENRTHAVVVAERRGLIPPKQDGVTRIDTLNPAFESLDRRSISSPPARLAEHLAAA